MSTPGSHLDAKTVLNLLRAEVTVQRRHLQLLLDQHSALLASNQPAFAAAHARYEAFSVELEAHALLRRELLGETKSLRELVNTFSPSEKAAGNALLDGLARLIDRLRLIAVQNTEMVSNQLQYTQFMLSVMVRTGRRNSNYGPATLTGPAPCENIFINQVA
jgi:hypothetical protein